MSQPPVNPKNNSGGIDLFLFTIPQSFMVQVGSASLIMLLLAEKATVATLEAIGQSSEEIFRGERLPMLDFPDIEKSNRS
jgi:hypothetical protein